MMIGTLKLYKEWWGWMVSFSMMKLAKQNHESINRLFHNFINSENYKIKYQNQKSENWKLQNIFIHRPTMEHIPTLE